MPAARLPFLFILLIFTSTAVYGAFLVGTGENSVAVNAQSHILFASEQDEFNPSAAPINQLLHEGNVRGEYRSYSLGITFSNSLMPTDSGNLTNPFVLEKKSLEGRNNQVAWVVGDSHQELGKGIALSLYSDSAFGINNTLEGASVSYVPPGTKVQLFAGRVNALEIPVAINPTANTLGDRNLWLGGVDAEKKVTKETTLGTHYLLALNQPNGEDFDRRWHTFGARMSRSGLMDGWDLYLESNLLLTQRLGENEEDLPNGYGTYAAISYFPMPWLWKLEVKDYRNYRFEFRRPPTLEEDIVETLNTQDISAARVSAERRFVGTKTSVEAAFLAGEDRVKESPVNHGVLGVKFAGPLSGSIEVRSGYRWLPGKENLAHASLKTEWRTFKGQSLELGALKQIRNTNLDSIPTRQDRNLLSMTYNFSSDFNLSLGYEYTPTNDLELGQHFGNLGASYTTGAFVSKAFIGKTNGGTQCSGGVCRQVPPFTGGMVESTYSF